MRGQIFSKIWMIFREKSGWRRAVFVILRGRNGVGLGAIGGAAPACGSPEVFSSKRSKVSLTFIAHACGAVQAEAPMTAPEEGVSSLIYVAERLLCPAAHSFTRMPSQRVLACHA